MEVLKCTNEKHFMNNFILIIITFLIILSMKQNLLHAEILSFDQEVNAEPYQETENEFHKVTLSNNSTYLLSVLPKSNVLADQFRSMSAAEQASFYENRLKIIRPILEGLSTQKKKQFLGKMIVFQDRILRVFKKSKETFSSIELSNQEIGKAEIQRLIEKLDETLWESCMVLAKVNQKGKSISLSILLGAGVLKKGKLLGASLGIGFFQDINTGKRYLEFFYTKDYFDKAYTYALPTFIGVKVNWLNWRYKPEKSDINNIGKGYSFPMWFPKLFTSPNEFQMTSKFGIDFVDLIIPFQTIAQFYETSWKRHVFRTNLNFKKLNLCNKFYIQKGKEEL